MYNIVDFKNVLKFCFKYNQDTYQLIFILTYITTNSGINGILESLIVEFKFRKIVVKKCLIDKPESRK